MEPDERALPDQLPLHQERRGQALDVADVRGSGVEAVVEQRVEPVVVGFEAEPFPQPLLQGRVGNSERLTRPPGGSIRL